MRVIISGISAEENGCPVRIEQDLRMPVGQALVVKFPAESPAC